MFGNFSEQMKKSTKPANTLLEMNAKTLELVSKQQTVFFSGVMTDSVKLLSALNDQTELKDMLAAQSVYAESVRERLTSASKTTYSALSAMRQDVADVVKTSFADATEDAKAVVTEAVAKVTPAPAKKATVAKKAPAPKKAAATKKAPVAKQAPVAKTAAPKTVTPQATPPVVEKPVATPAVEVKAPVSKAPAKKAAAKKTPVAKKATAAPAATKAPAPAKKVAAKKKVAELSPADVKADSTKND
ncbi:phasin family protein [Glaciecola sp. XM2]|uniref:phasin family protein n=1 Tax=Glaciecola sp. XM2 TaxID=1914931 RepID=UPI001BDF5B4D|nr:phasin family protein [Glaciecola sp. XM2]MBT1451638.1 phasin family protein [Glaciecola sp. XM2]